MTTAVAEKVGSYKELQRGPVAVARIVVESNFRKSFNKERLEELADSIKKVGVLEPVLLRFKGNAHVLIAGERRLRAAKIAGLQEIPARILDVNDDQAAEIQALENLHREDLGPIEEARAFKTLLDQGKYDVKGLADRIDKSEAYVYRSLKLLELTKEAVKAIEEGEISPSAGHQLLRAPQDVQKELAKQLLSGRINTIGDLAEAIEERVGRDLAKAPFPKDKVYANEVACTRCPYNSGNQGMLFDGAEKGRCTNGGCFDKKLNHHLEQQADQAAEKRGLKNIGVVEKDYDESVKGKKGSRIVPQEAVHDLIQAHPEKFAVAVVKPRWHGDKPEVKTVCLDTSILPREGRHMPTPKEKATRKAELARQKREALIRQAMFREAYNKLPGQPTKVMWVTIVNELDKSYRPMEIWKALGVPKNGSSQVELSELEKLDVSTLARIAFLLSAGEFHDGWSNRPRKDYLAMGLKPADLRTKAVKEVAQLEKRVDAKKKT